MELVTVVGTAVSFKGEGHSRKGVFFEITNKKITLS